MSFIKDAKSEIGKAEKWLATVWGKEPNFSNVLSMGINTVGISLETIFTLDGNGAVATLIGGIVSKAQQELAAVNSIVTTVGPTPAAKSVLAGIITDISQLETATGVKDPNSQAALKLALTTLQELINGFPAATTPVLNTAA